jgi:hypothetical protein
MLNKCHLNPCLQIRQFIDHKNGSVGTWHKSIVDDALIVVAEFHGCGLDRINITDQIGY